MSEGYKSISFTSPSGSWKSGVGVPGQFPAGLRVLVVDDDSTCLQILDKMLRNCLYKVTKCSQAEVALQLLREEKDGFDIVISDVHMPDMDGFKLLELIGLEMDLPVIMMSADDTRSVVMQGVTHGACDYLIKPVHMGALNNIWQHVVRKKKYEWKEKDSEQSGSAEDGVQLRKPLEDVDDSSRNEGHCKNFKKRKDDVDEVEERDDISTMKKQRVVWSPELRMQFEIAVNLLGVDKAVPKKILEIMNVAGLTRENVASHLQKYRQSLTRMNALGSSFMRPANTSFSAISSLNGVDLQVDIPSNQLARHCVSSIQTPSLGRSATKPTTFVSPVDQKRILSFENSKIRFMEGEGPRQPSSNVEQVNMLHGSPTDMDSKKLSILDPAAQFAFGSINLHIRSPANQNNLFNQTNGANIMNLTSVNQPQMIPSVASLVRRDFCGPVYSVSQPCRFFEQSGNRVARE